MFAHLQQVHPLLSSSPLPLAPPTPLPSRRMLHLRPCCTLIYFIKTFESFSNLPLIGVMYLHIVRLRIKIHSRFHLDAFSVTELLIFDELFKFKHFAVRLNLCHVLLYGELLALKKPTLLALVHKQTCKCVYEKICPAVVQVALNH